MCSVSPPVQKTEEVEFTQEASNGWGWQLLPRGQQQSPGLSLEPLYKPEPGTLNAVLITSEHFFSIK
jgi:hypothetical protein